MIATSAFDVLSGSDFHEKPIEGTSTSASNWHEARVPVNRKRLEESSYFTGSPVDFQTILKVIRAGVAIVPGWPARLIDHRDVLHFQRKRVLVRTDRQATLQNRNDPVESRRRNGRVKIVYLVCRDRRSPEQRQSYMREGALLRSSRAPILSLHHAVVGRRTAKSDAVSLVVGAGGLRKTAQSNCRSPRNAGPKSVIVLLCVSTPTISQFQTCRTKLCRPTFV